MKFTPETLIMLRGTMDISETIFDQANALGLWGNIADVQRVNPNLTLKEVAFLLVVQSRRTETFRLVRVKRGLSSGSKSPKYEFTAATGETVWAFEHAESERNTAPLFFAAGWGALKDLVVDKDHLLYTPIVCECVLDGQFYRPVRVLDAPEQVVIAESDEAVREMVATELGRELEGFYYDSETVGLTPANIVEYAFVCPDGQAISNLVQCAVPTGEFALGLHGITQEMSQEGQPIDVAFEVVRGYLAKYTVAVFNKKFEVQALLDTFGPERMKMLNLDNLFDTMPILSLLVKRNGRYAKLSEVAALLEVEMPTLHRAAPDALILKQICDKLVMR